MSEIVPVPARVFGIPARDAAVIALLRRGPSKWTRLILWHVAEDRFELGQWFHGRIYEHRCALSPDGQLFVYFAQKLGHRGDPSYTYAWTAVSKPPYFTALALWPKGDCWNGGGVFAADRTLRLNHANGYTHPNHPPTGLKVIVGASNSWFRQGEDEPVHSAILEQLGWSVVQPLRIDDRREQMLKAFTRATGPDGKRQQLIVQATQPLIRERAHPAGRYQLRWTWYGVDYNQIGENDVFDYALRDDQAHTETPLSGAAWADWDQRGRLAYVRDGRVYAVTPDAIGSDPPPLIDLNDQTPAAIKSPALAKRWPDAE